MSDVLPARPAVRIGDWVSVSPQKGYIPARGAVVRVDDDGFDVLDPYATRESERVLQVKWTYVAALEHPAPPPMLTRTYSGRQQIDAGLRFEKEASAFGAAGYRVVSQSWAAGQWDSTAWAIAVLASIFVVGIFALLYLVVVTPDGSLAVTFARSEAGPATPSVGNAVPTLPVVPSAPVPGPVAKTLSERLFELSAAHGAGLLTDEEYERKREAIISEH